MMSDSEHRYAEAQTENPAVQPGRDVLELSSSHVSVCQMINLLAHFPALLLPPSGDLSNHLASAFLPSPNIYPQIDLRRTSSVTFKCLDVLSPTQTCLNTHVHTHTRTHTQPLFKAANRSFYLVIVLLFQCRKERSQYLAKGS